MPREPRAHRIHRRLGAKLCAVSIVASVSFDASPTSGTPASVPGAGESKATAIEVCRPAGQRAYLSRLVCADGLTPEYRRVGSFGPRTEIPNDLTQEQQKILLDKLRGAIPPQPGEPDYHIVDGYELSCGAEKRIIYMDMYHCGQPLPAEAPRGFGLRPE